MVDEIMYSVGRIYDVMGYSSYIYITEATYLACKKLDISDDIIQRYAKSLTEHIRSVGFAYCDVLGLRRNGGLLHDKSKWTPEEFPFYARHFHGGGDPVGLAGAWLHHIHNNPHHWQHWMFPDGYSPDGPNVIDGCLEMPAEYVNEMVADWIGSSVAYTGKDDMTDWLKDNYSKIRLHPNSRYHLEVVLAELGYIKGREYA